MEAHSLSFLGASSRVIVPTQDDRPVVPLRSEEEKEFAQLCTRAHRGGVYIKHHRKAGGSSLYSILNRQVCSHTPVYSSELPFFNATHSFSTLPNSTVFITSLRDPIDRILSLYWFEGRWPRTCELACELNKTKDDSTKVADLDEWIEAVYHQSKKSKYKLRYHSSCGQWQSVENYYTRQLLGVDRGDERQFLNKTLTDDDLYRAKQILASFDLVMIQERYQSDRDMVRIFKTITAANPGQQQQQGLPHERKGVERTSASYQAPSTQDLKVGTARSRGRTTMDDPARCTGYSEEAFAVDSTMYAATEKTHTTPVQRHAGWKRMSFKAVFLLSSFRESTPMSVSQ